MADPQNEITLGRAGVDDPVIARAELEEAGELARQRLAGRSLLGERPLDLSEDSESDAAIEPVEISRY